ncbi:MAG: hypothetical protein J5I93_05125, partial [Pirellulaceae bacterium]|nr:hypothetical protein [Pirellulaceae bacterium]
MSAALRAARGGQPASFRENTFHEFSETKQASVDNYDFHLQSRFGSHVKWAEDGGFAGLRGCGARDGAEPASGRQARGAAR